MLRMFVQLLLFLDECGGRSEIASLEGHVDTGPGPGGARAWALRAQYEVGVVECFEADDGNQEVVLTNWGRWRVDGIKAGMRASGDPRLDPRWWRHEYGPKARPPPLSLLLYDEPPAVRWWLHWRPAGDCRNAAAHTAYARSTVMRTPPFVRPSPRIPVRPSDLGAAVMVAADLIRGQQRRASAVSTHRTPGSAPAAVPSSAPPPSAPGPLVVRASSPELPAASSSTMMFTPWYGGFDLSVRPSASHHPDPRRASNRCRATLCESGQACSGVRAL